MRIATHVVFIKLSCNFCIAGVLCLVIFLCQIGFFIVNGPVCTSRVNSIIWFFQFKNFIIVFTDILVVVVTGRVNSSHFRWFLKFNYFVFWSHQTWFFNQRWILLNYVVVNLLDGFLSIHSLLLGLISIILDQILMIIFYHAFNESFCFYPMFFVFSHFYWLIEPECRTENFIQFSRNRLFPIIKCCFLWGI